MRQKIQNIKTLLALLTPKPITALPLLLLLSSLSAEAAIISISAPETAVQPGQSFEIGLKISDLGVDTSLGAFDIDLVSSGLSVTLQSISFLDSNLGVNALDLPETEALPFVGDGSQSGNRIDAFGISGNSAEVLSAQQPDSFTFARLLFIADKTGSANFTLDLTDPLLYFSDASGLPVIVNFATTQTTVNVASVPVPGAVVLFVSGLVGCFAGCRRRSLV